MKILALDFSTLRRSVAVLQTEGEPRALNSATQQAQRLGSPFPVISEALGQIAPAEIGAIAVGLGPGSYTGVRSSLAIAQGWNLARNIPCAGVSSVDAIAYEAWLVGMRGKHCVVIDAQRKEFYWQTHRITDEGCEPLHPLRLSASPLGLPWIGPEVTSWVNNGIIVEPTARAIGLIAMRENKFVRPEELEPIYLREPSFVKAPAVRHA